MKKIGIIGPNKTMCNERLYEYGVQLGETIASKDRTILCGGLGGFMEAVCKGVKQSRDTFNGQTIGILPEENESAANPFVDIVIPTSIGIARNVILVRSSDIIIAAGGGAGTLSEIALAWQCGKHVLCVTQFDGWAKELAGKNLDNRNNGLLLPVNRFEEILQYITNA